MRLSNQDHKLLQLLCLLTDRSQNNVVVELLHREFDRVMPGKREEFANPDPDALWKALGVPRPEPGPLAERWADSVITGLYDDEEEGQSGRRAA